ncbi:hypothetical protein [Streptomyces sp. KL110A]|uniref:hypothetical protein n=1 Tax=Streptomyces sp. KL110A TaxID=3384221 RepID=UPI0038CA39D3
MVEASLAAITAARALPATWGTLRSIFRFVPDPGSAGAFPGSGGRISGSSVSVGCL